MYDRNYYAEKKLSFDVAYNNMVSEDSAALRAVLEGERLQEERDRRAFSENEDFESFTALAESMDIETPEDFEIYLSKCLGGNLRRGVNYLKNNPEAFFVSSLALAEDKKALAVTAADNGGERILVREKKVVKRTWSEIEGFKKTEKTVNVPMTKREIKTKSFLLGIFPEMRNVVVKDKKFPIYPIVSVLLCMVLFIIPVFLTILNTEIAVENKEYDTYIRQLEGDINSLEDQLAVKNDMELINSLAREEYGMIDVELSDVRLMEDSSENIVLANGEKEELPNIFVALLNAIGVLGE